MIECDNFDLENGFYLNLMHSLSVIALLINLFAIYCIVCKSTKQMGTYKWYLFAYQIASTAFDLVYTGLTLPVIFFPIPMGYPGAWIAQWLSISSHAAVISVILTCSLLVATILNLFNYRCHLVTPNYHFLKINAKVFILSKVKRIVMTVVALAILALVLCVVSNAAIALLRTLLSR
ncbi:7TM chemoreceptor [Cooperia oncophora]